MATNDTRNLIHADSEEFGINIDATPDAGDTLALAVTVDSRQGYIASLSVDSETAIRIGDLAHTYRNNSDGTWKAADTVFTLLNAIDSEWVEKNGITREWLQG